MRLSKTCLRERAQPEAGAGTSAATAGQKSKVNSTKQIINQAGNYTQLTTAAVKLSHSKSPSANWLRYEQLTELQSSGVMRKQTSVQDKASNRLFLLYR